MIGVDQIAEAGAHLAGRAGGGGPAALDRRIDIPRADQDAGAASVVHAKHQLLMRAYQSRYVILPGGPGAGSVLADLRQRREPAQAAALDRMRRSLEDELVAPRAAAAIGAAQGADALAYAEALIAEVRAADETAFVAYLRGQPERAHHYRNFLLQSSPDLLAEASASAFGVIGSFGPAQSALFRILIDEFGYGAHGRKHSVLFQAAMRSFGLDDEYNAYWPLFDTVALDLHNLIHYLFQNPGNVFLQVGFLLFAETAYQRSTHDHFRYLRECHRQADARYFGEHAHIDLHHTRMVVQEVVLPLVRAYGDEVGEEIVAGAELTREAFAAAGTHLLAVSRAFAAAVAEGEARYGAPTADADAPALTPDMARGRRDQVTPVRVGGLGVVSAAAFATFPTGAYGRTLRAGGAR